MRCVALTALSVLLPAVVIAPAEAAPRDPLALQRVVLNRMNTARGHIGLAPLVWNNKLEQDAARWAAQVAATGAYAHDRSPERRRTQGENMWRGPRGYWPYETMIDSMLAEKRFYRPGTFPANSVTGDWSAVGHYTQIIWPTTTMVGCALAAGYREDYLVCRFAPKGNVEGITLP